MILFTRSSQNKNSFALKIQNYLLAFKQEAIDLVINAIYSVKAIVIVSMNK